MYPHTLNIVEQETGTIGVSTPCSFDEDDDDDDDYCYYYHYNAVLCYAMPYMRNAAPCSNTIEKSTSESILNPTRKTIAHESRGHECNISFFK